MDRAPASKPAPAAHGGRLARLFLASRESVAEFDASAPEVLLMTQGLAAARSAQQPEWDQALANPQRPAA